MRFYGCSLVSWKMPFHSCFGFIDFHLLVSFFPAFILCLFTKVISVPWEEISMCHLSCSPCEWLIKPAGQHWRCSQISRPINEHVNSAISCVFTIYMSSRRTWAWPWWASGGTCAQWGPSECPGWSARGSGAPCESPLQAGGTRSLHLWMGRSNEGDPKWLKGWWWKQRVEGQSP